MKAVVAGDISWPGDDAFSHILEEMDRLSNELTSATVELSFQQDEIQAMKTRLNALLTERDSWPSCRACQSQTTKEKASSLSRFS